jgi:hypothetical protein
LKAEGSSVPSARKTERKSLNPKFMKDEG